MTLGIESGHGSRCLRVNLCTGQVEYARHNRRRREPRSVHRDRCPRDAQNYCVETEAKWALGNRCALESIWYGCRKRVEHGRRSTQRTGDKGRDTLQVCTSPRLRCDRSRRSQRTKGDIQHSAFLLPLERTDHLWRRAWRAEKSDSCAEAAANHAILAGKKMRRQHR